MLINKRTLKKLISRKCDQGFRKLDCFVISRIIFVLSFILFLSSQLFTNAILSPLGHELQSLNTEKNLLLEDNRILEQEIAKDSSLTIIKAYSKAQFDIKDDSKHQSIFITDNSIQALR